MSYSDDDDNDPEFRVESTDAVYAANFKQALNKLFPGAIYDKIDPLKPYTSEADGPADISLPAGLVTIEEGAFEGIGAGSVKVGDGVSSIGARAFADCENLTAILIPGTVESIHDTAHEGSDTVTIYGEALSEAERHARENDIPFVLLGDGQEYYYTEPEPPLILPFVPMT